MRLIKQGLHPRRALGKPNIHPRRPTRQSRHHCRKNATHEQKTYDAQILNTQSATIESIVPPAGVIMRMQLLAASATMMLPDASKLTPWTARNWACSGLVLSMSPALPGLPPTVDTTGRATSESKLSIKRTLLNVLTCQEHVPPLGVMRRMTWLTWSATNKLPEASRATPMG